MTQGEANGRDATVLRRAFAADEVDLFLFSAACWLSHRIHYDADYARSEGLADVPVHGPLQASWLAQLTSDWARAHGGRLRQVAIRNLTSAFPGEVLTCRATVTARHIKGDTESISLDLAIDSDRSGTVTSGSAMVDMPAAAQSEGS